MNQRLLIRYGIAASLMAIAYLSAFVGGLAHPVFYMFGIIGVPVAALWVFWMIAHEPPVERAGQKTPRFAAILLVLAAPLTLLAASLSIIATDDEGVASAIAVLFIGPWAVIQIVAGAIALWAVTSQKLAPPETESARDEVG